MPSLFIEKPASIDPVSLDDMKNFLRVEIDDDDVLIGGLISAATLLCENFTRRSFINKGFRQCLDAFPYFVDTIMSQMAYPPSYYSLPRYSTTLWNYSQMVKLFRPKCQSVDRITYLSSSDEQWHDLVPVPLLWYPGTSYTLNAVVMDPNGNQQKCIQAGTSNSQPPAASAWSQVIGGDTAEVNPDPGGEGTGPVVWQNIGPLPSAKVFPGAPPGTSQFGTFLTDLDSEPARIFPGPPGFYWPNVLYTPNSVQLHYTAGFGATADAVPPNIITAIMRLVGDLYENREPMPNSPETLPRAIKALLWPSVVWDFQPTRG